MKIVLKLLLWVVLLGGIFYIIRSLWTTVGEEDPIETINQTTVLEKVESLGKLELVKYNFQEITELTQKNSRYLGIFPAGDSKAVLISHGEAVGCLDLTKIAVEDIQMTLDTLYIHLPVAEICYYKLDLERTRIYSIEKGVYYQDQKVLIEKAYKAAEKQIREAALSSGILENTTENAERILKPFLEEVTGKQIVFTTAIQQQEIEIID